MAWALAIFGVAFAAAVVWLGVRIVNRHERWAKRTLTASLLSLLLLYSLGVGPISRFAKTQEGPVNDALRWAHSPIILAYNYGPGPIHDVILWYVDLWN